MALNRPIQDILKRRRSEMISIPPGSKYAALALPIRHLRQRMSDSVSLGSELYATRTLPFPLPDHWKEWLGTIQAEALKSANFFLLTHAASKNPEVLDQENKDLIEKIHQLYFGFLIAGPYVGHDDGLLMTGTRQESEVDVRQIQHYDPVFVSPGCHGAHLDDVMLHEARRIADGVAPLEGAGEYSRMWRITRAFCAAVRAHELGVRLHQFVRSIEGFVLPDIGQTKRQMRARTRLFLGSGHEALVDSLFDIRSAVEHLHEPLGAVSGINDTDKELKLAELCYKSEAIARYCLCRLFTNRELWCHFKDDASLKTFWSLDSDARQKIWDAPLDTAKAFSHFKRNSAALSLKMR
ncbi:MAG: hypothetical protein AB1411_07230 [Nitrospirota bacterium]